MADQEPKDPTRHITRSIALVLCSLIFSVAGYYIVDILVAPDTLGLFINVNAAPVSLQDFDLPVVAEKVPFSDNTLLNLAVGDIVQAFVQTVGGNNVNLNDMELIATRA